MSTNVLRTICEGLNAEPFNRNLTMVKLDTQTPEKLLQTLSDVIGWIQGLPEEIDIRSEMPEETVIRLMNALRVLKYQPPRDIDQIQKWRLDLLEGNKAVIYPILEWIFENVDRLKERVYLARYLTKLEVPPEFQTSPDLAALAHLIDQKMEEFKAIHMQIVDARADYLRTEDIRADLKTMAEEREQLLRKIEKNRKRVARMPQLEKHLEFAGKFHTANERAQELQLQLQEQRNALVLAGQRLTRLEKAFAEQEREKNTNDPDVLMTKLRREIEVNTYIVNEKILNNIATQRQSIHDIQKILSIGNITKESIQQRKETINRLNDEISQAQMEGDRQHQGNGEDKLSIHRHQSANLQRKKANVADQLQATKQELDGVESILAGKKREITEKSGREEYKLYVKKLRTKSNFYKRKKAEIEQMKAEIQILERTVELLGNRFEELKRDCRNEGRSVIEESELSEDISPGEVINSHSPKPMSTNVNELKEMIDSLNRELDEKRVVVQEFREKMEEFYQQHKEDNEELYAYQNKYEDVRDRIRDEQKQIEKAISTLEARLTKCQEDLKKNTDNLTTLEWFAKNLKTSQEAEMTIKNLELQNSECSKAVSQLNRNLEELAQKSDDRNEYIIWNNLIQIFNIKISKFQKK